MKRYVFITVLALVVSLLLSACGGNANGGDVSETLTVTEESDVTLSRTVYAHGIQLNVPEDAVVSDVGTVIINLNNGTDNITVVSATGSLDDFSQKNMTAALQTEFDFDSFNSYEKTELNGAQAVIYSFDTVVEETTLYLKQVNVQVGDNVVTVTYCLTDKANEGIFEKMLASVAVTE